MRTVPSAVGHLKAADTADRQGDDAVREERKETAENTGCVLHGRSGILRKYIGMNAYKKSRMQNVLNAAGLKMTPETYMAYAYLKAGSIFLLILPALHVFPLLAILIVLLGVMVYYKETKKSRRAGKGKKRADRGRAVPFCFHHHTGAEKQQGCTFHAGAL